MKHRIIFKYHRLLFLLAIRSLHQRPPESAIDKEEVENRQVSDGRRREPGRRVAAAWKVQEGSLAKLSLDAKLPNISVMFDVNSLGVNFTFQYLN